MGTQKTQTLPRELGSVEQQIQNLAVLVKDMVQTEIELIRTDMSHVYDQMMSSVEKRIDNRTHLNIELTMTDHQPFAAPRVCNPPGFMSDPQARHNLLRPFSHTSESLPTKEGGGDNTINPQQLRWKQEKAFQHRLTAKGIKYDGSSRVNYRPWKETLEREVQGLQLETFQWLDLLEARTDGISLDAIKENRIMAIENSPEYALKVVWAKLHNQFHTEDRPSKQLLKELQNGPPVLTSDASKLFSFAQRCNNIADLHHTHPTSLSILEDQATQDEIVERLDEDLSIKWYEYKKLHLSQYKLVPFQIFASSIEIQAEVYLEREERRTQAHKTK